MIGEAVRSQLGAKGGRFVLDVDTYDTASDINAIIRYRMVQQGAVLEHLIAVSYERVGEELHVQWVDTSAQ